MASQLNHRFSITIREIESALRSLWGNDRKFHFVDAAYGQVGSGVSAKDAQLLEIAWEVRGLLAHQSVNGQDPVEASPQLVRSIEQIRNRLAGRVPTVQGLLNDVTIVSPDTQVSEAATTMAREDFSCLPVYDDRRFVGAIDSDAVLRWIGNHLTDAGIMEDSSVGQLLSGAGPMIEFHRKDSPQRDVVASFEEALSRGAPLVAVLLTSDGTRTGRLGGIITPWDVPSLDR